MGAVAAAQQRAARLPMPCGCASTTLLATPPATSTCCLLPTSTLPSVAVPPPPHPPPPQGSKVSVNDFLIKAVALALAEVPAANALWDSRAGVPALAPSVDISVAVATEGGLITPIVKAANTKSLVQISAEVGWPGCGGWRVGWGGAGGGGGRLAGLWRLGWGGWGPGRRLQAGWGPAATGGSILAACPFCRPIRPVLWPTSRPQNTLPLQALSCNVPRPPCALCAHGCNPLGTPNPPSIPAP